MVHHSSRLHRSTPNVSPCVQVACERYDARAFLKKWDGCFVAIGSFMGVGVLAFGSTRDKTVSRAVRGGGSAAADKVMQIAGCVSAAVALQGRMHVMSVSFPATPGVTQQFFAFATAVARDAFMRELAAAETKAAAEAKAFAETKAFAEANAAAEAYDAALAEANAAAFAEAKAAAAAVAAAPAIAHALQRMQLQVPSLPAQPELLLMNVLLLLAVLNRFRIEPLSLTARCSISWPPFSARA